MGVIRVLLVWPLVQFKEIQRGWELVTVKLCRLQGNVQGNFASSDQFTSSRYSRKQIACRCMEHAPTHEGILILILSHECCGSPLVPSQYIVTFSGILSALSVSLCGGILPNLLEPVIQCLKGEDWEIVRDHWEHWDRQSCCFLLLVNFSSWGSYHNMASQLLLEGCVDVLDSISVRLACSHSLDSTPYHGSVWNVGNFSKTQDFTAKEAVICRFSTSQDPTWTSVWDEAVVPVFCHPALYCWVYDFQNVWVFERTHSMHAFCGLVHSWNHRKVSACKQKQL